MAVRKARNGETLKASTLFIPEKVDTRYAKVAAKRNKSKSKLMSETLISHKP